VRRKDIISDSGVPLWIVVTAYEYPCPPDIRANGTWPSPLGSLICKLTMTSKPHANDLEHLLFFQSTSSSPPISLRLRRQSPLNKVKSGSPLNSSHRRLPQTAWYCHQSTPIKFCAGYWYRRRSCVIARISMLLVVGLAYVTAILLSTPSSD
jgi:hypothetical protein